MTRFSVCEAAEATAERREDLLVFGLCLHHVAVSSTIVMFLCSVSVYVTDRVCVFEPNIVSGMRDQSVCVFVCLYLYTECMCNYN